MTQPSLFVPPQAPAHRVQALATVIAGMVFPARGSFEKLTQAQQTRVLAAAQDCLDRFVGEA